MRLTLAWVCLFFPALQPRTCANYNPITNPGEQFECPADTEFDPEAGNKTNPDVAACCRVRELSRKGTPAAVTLAPAAAVAMAA